MKRLSCESVTDLLPDRSRDRLNEIDRLRVDRHVEACASCRAQRELLGIIGNARPAVPPGLHTRVARAVVARRPARRRAGAGIAAAAGIVFALVTGGLLVMRGEPSGGGEAPIAQDLGATMRAVRPDDPLLAGGPAFARLSVEELATLLAEMDR